MSKRYITAKKALNDFIQTNPDREPIVHAPFVFNGGNFFVVEDNVPRLLTAKDCTPEEVEQIELVFAAEIAEAKDNRLSPELEALHVQAQQQLDALFVTRDQILAAGCTFVIKRTTNTIEVRKPKRSAKTGSIQPQVAANDEDHQGDSDSIEDGTPTEPAEEPQPDPQVGTGTSGARQLSPPTQDVTSPDESDKKLATDAVAPSQGGPRLVPAKQKYFPETTSELEIYIDKSTRKSGLAVFGDSEEKFRLFCYAFLAHPPDYNSKKPLISLDDILKIRGAYRTKTSIQKSFDLLKDHGVRVLKQQKKNGPAFIASFDYPKDWGWPLELVQPQSPIHERVRIFDGVSFDRGQLEHPTPEVETDCPEMTQNLLGILNDPANTFDGISGMIDELRKLNQNLFDSNQSRETYRCNAAMLHKLETYEKEIYHKRSKNARIYPTNISCCSRELRKEMQKLSGFTVFDLQASQLWLIAHAWKLPELRTYLMKKGSFWENICSDCGLDVRIHKNELKTMVYALTYGSSMLSAQRDLISAHGKEVAKRVRSHDIIKLLGKAFRKKLVEARLARRKQDCFGREYDAATMAKARSAVAQVIQALEHKIVCSLALRVSEIDGVKLRMYLHDGFAIQSNRDVESDVREIFDNICKSHNIIMKLDCERHVDFSSNQPIK
ncbi:MAG: hypothetical protein KDC26_06290 [Armatimonadetes bacterium]|nr:hypothetical protein [Armatimonadota bacterium]